MKNDNRGTSLIELIFIMAILAVLACSVGLGVSMISGKPAEQCARKLKSVLQSNRVTTMGKNEAYLKIFYTPQGEVMVIEYYKKPDGTWNLNKTIVSKKDVVVEYEIDNSGTYIPLGHSIMDALTISFNRSSGAFNDLSRMGSSYTGKYCTSIKVSKGSTVKTLDLIYLTGKITMN